MKSKHFATLEAAIDKWMEDASCDDRNQLSRHYIAEGTVGLMAKAAEAVFDAAEDAQAFMEANDPKRRSA